MKKKLVFSIEQLLLLRSDPRLFDIVVDVLQQHHNSPSVTVGFALMLARDRLNQLPIPFNSVVNDSLIINDVTGEVSTRAVVSDASIGIAHIKPAKQA